MPETAAVETNAGSKRTIDRHSATDARLALGEIAQLRTQAAARMRTPRWMWQVLGLLSAAWIGSLALPNGWGLWANWILLGCFLLTCAAIGRRTGSGPFEATKLGRWGALLLLMPSLAVVVATVVALRSGAGGGVLALAAIAEYLSFIILGPFSERRIGAPTRPLS